MDVDTKDDNFSDTGVGKVSVVHEPGVSSASSSGIDRKIDITEATSAATYTQNSEDVQTGESFEISKVKREVTATEVNVASSSDEVVEDLISEAKKTVAEASKLPEVAERSKIDEVSGTFSPTEALKKGQEEKVEPVSFTDTSKLSSRTEVVETSESTESIKKEKPLTKSSSSRVITADTTHILIEPSHIIEYEWPPKSGERFFIQEQIAELLDVKSFKRKYPDLNRHTIEINEREHLLTAYKLASVMSEHQMHGLTAVRAIEVHELMANDYSAVYSEYQRATAEKAKLQIAEQQKQLDAIKMDTKKLQELRKNAIRSAFEFNADMNSIKNTERRHFWDIQTSIIQSSQNRWKRMPKYATRPSPYPVALIPGQYQDYYKRFTSAQLRQLPLNSVLEYEHLLPLKKERSPSPINVPEATLDSLNDTQSSDFVKMETLGTHLQSAVELNHQV